MVLKVYDEFTNKLIYCEYETNELFYLGESSFSNKSSCIFYIPDSFTFASVPLVDIEKTLILEDILNDSEEGFWFDGFSFEDVDICSMLQPHLWFCFYSTPLYENSECQGLFNCAKLPFFFRGHLSEKNLGLSANLSFVRHLNVRTNFRKQWFCWFLGFRTQCIVALFFRFCSFTVWFKTIGEGAFCSKVDDTHVQVCLGENHDILFETLDYVYIKEKPKSTRVFGCFSFHRPNLMSFAHKVRTYYVFNVYEYRGLLYLCERVRKKVTKRRVR